MKTQGVLLVNFSGEEVETVRKIFKQLKIHVTVFPVFNGRAALDMLMGSYGPAGVRPDIVMVSSRLPDMSSVELLSIIRKYYSLGNIRFYVLADAGEKFDGYLNGSLKISNVLHRPLKADRQVLELLSPLKGKPENHRLGLLAAFALLKQKFAGLPAAFSGVAKAAACVSAAIIPGVAAIHSLQNEQKEPYNAPYVEVMRVTPERSPAISVPVDAEEFVEPIEQKPAPVVVEEPLPVVDTIAVETPVHDSVPPVKKTYSIGVKKAGEPQ